MFPETGSKVLYPSFNSPLPIPVQPPDGGPTVAVTLSCSWLPYIRGALAQLTQPYSWDRSDLAAALQAQDWAMTLIAMFVECVDALPPVSCGYDFTVSQEGWIVHPTYGVGTYVAGVGFVGTFNGSNNVSQLITLRSLSGSIQLTSFDIDYDGGTGGAGADNIINLFYDTGGGLVNLAHGPLQAGANTFGTFTNIPNVTSLVVEMNSGTASGPSVLKAVRINGLDEGGFSC